MALDDYRMLAPQRQIGEPSSLENVIAQAMMSKLSPEMMQGYYLQARGQRQRHAAELGAQQAVATTAGLLASDRTADYELLGKAIANPNAASAFLPKRVSDAYLTPGQGEVGQTYTGYHLNKVAAEGRQANASADKSMSDIGFFPKEYAPDGTVTVWGHDQRPDVTIAQLQAETSASNAKLSSDTSILTNRLTNDTNRLNNENTVGGQALQGGLNRQFKGAALDRALSGKDQAIAQTLAAKAAEHAAQQYADNPLNLRKSPAVRAAETEVVKKEASDFVFQTFNTHRSDPTVQAATAAAMYDPEDPLAGVPAAAAGGAVAPPLAKPVQPSPAAGTAPSDRGPGASKAVRSMALPGAAMPPGMETFYEPVLKRVAAGGTINKYERIGNIPVVKWTDSAGGKHTSTPHD